VSSAHANKGAIFAALFANLGIAAIKLVAALLSGSSALLSEGVHSLVDSSNELLLLYGLRRADARRDRQHPLGHGRELYFWSFIVALLVFALGAGISLYEGVAHFRHPEVNRRPWLTYAVLVVSALFDGYSFSVAFAQFRRSKGNLSYLAAILQSKDPTAFAVLLEDAAALLGIGIATLGVLAAQVFEEPRLDGLASIGIGCVLAATAGLMARECKALLIGESASPELEAALVELAARDPAVARVNGVLTFHLAPHQVVAALSAAFANHLTTPEIEASVARLEAVIRAAHPQIALLFLKPQTSSAFAQSVLVRELVESDREAAESAAIVGDR
jgi:cation diffusion facilitator family transporter